MPLNSLLIITRLLKRNLRFLLELAWNDFLRLVFYQYFPKKPKVINFPVNDICNSRCVMCNIWEKKQGKELSSDELREILKDTLYEEVTHVGLSGGEPTLRKDLVDLVVVIIDTLPELKGISLITNAIVNKKVIPRVLEVAEFCRQKGVKFGVMVSLDGYGEVHDRVRGREGNFDSVMKAVDAFNQAGLKVSLGATVVKDNVWGLDELLSFVKAKDVYCKFRVAEFINRLYNEAQKSDIRNFSPDEIYQLRLFFNKLFFTYEKDPDVRATYKNIQAMLGGASRQVGCPYQSEGVLLEADGGVAYCAPKSPRLGNALENSSWDIYRGNLAERRKIIHNDCQSCIHDYHFRANTRRYISQLQQELTEKLFSLNAYFLIKRIAGFFPKKTLSDSCPIILIVGWYGTETVGDKAILAGIIEDYKKQYCSAKFCIASLYPFITERTCSELNIDAEVISSKSIEILFYAKKADLVVMGGGPLMDLNELYVPLYAFEMARKAGNKTVIYGCGLGPLTDKYLKVVSNILQLSDEVLLRDEASKRLAENLTKRKDISVIADPAKAYVKSHWINDRVLSGNAELACFLREWPREYSSGLSRDAYIAKRNQFEKGLAAYIKYLAKLHGVTGIRFYHMHNFVIGGDDRDFSLRFINQYFKDEINVSFDEKLSSVDSILTAMKTSKFNLCMRFHSVLFAHTLDVDFLAIDYTLGGKISSYLSENKIESKMITMDEISTCHDRQTA